MTAVTISRQMGSLGSEIARLLADKLGYQFVWRELINRAAQQAGVPEVALAAIDELGLLELDTPPGARRAYRREAGAIITELAQKGRVVILGRGGQVILKDFPDVLHVRIVAPVALRAERIAQRTNVALECALAQIEASDNFRRNYLRRFFRVNPDDATLYHLILNTNHLGPQQAAEIITTAVNAMLSGS